MYTHLLLISTVQIPRAYCSFSIIIYLLYQNKCFCDFLWIWADMLECAIHPITYRGEGILATVVKWKTKFQFYILPPILSIIHLRFYTTYSRLTHGWIWVRISVCKNTLIPTCVYLPHAGWLQLQIHKP